MGAHAIFRVLVPIVILSASFASADVRDVVCIPPVAAQQPTEARCIFDIWGYVTDADGQPATRVIVSDGSVSAVTDGSGFYRLWHSGPGTYAVTAARTFSCSADAAVTVALVPAVIEGGKRQDFKLPC